MATPPINPPGPGPRPGAATGTRPGTGVTQDGRYVGGRLTVVISELQKLNGRNGIQKSNRHLEKIDSNIKDLLDFFVQQQRLALAATSQTPTQTGQQQGGQNQSSQRNQNKQTQQNQKNQQSGGIGSNLLNFLKSPAGAVTAGIGSVLGFPLIAATLKTLFNPKTVRGRAAIGVIGFAMADKIVDYLLGPKGESELRDEVDKIFNPEAALGFGFLGSMINSRLRNLFFIAGLFATNENIKKFDALMETVEEKGRDLKKLVDENVVPFFNEFFGIQLPTIQIGMQNISDGMGNAIVALNKIIDGDYKEIFTERGADLTFFALLGTKMAGLQKALRRSKNIKAKIAGYVLDGLMVALGLNMVTRTSEESQNIQNDGEENNLTGGEVAGLAATAAAVAGGQAIASKAYSSMITPKTAPGPSTGGKPGPKPPSATNQFNMSSVQKRILRRQGFRFDKLGTLMNPNGSGVASKAQLQAALNALGKPGLAAQVGKLGGKVLLRFLPGVGWAILAYDAIGVAKAIADELFDGDITFRQMSLTSGLQTMKGKDDEITVVPGYEKSAMDILSEQPFDPVSNTGNPNIDVRGNYIGPNKNNVSRKLRELSSLSGNTGAQTVINNYSTTQNMDQSQSVVLAQNDVPPTTDGVSLNNIGSVALLPA